MQSEAFLELTLLKLPKQEMHLHLSSCDPSGTSVDSQKGISKTLSLCVSFLFGEIWQPCFCFFSFWIGENEFGQRGFFAIRFSMTKNVAASVTN